MTVVVVSSLQASPKGTWVPLVSTSCAAESAPFCISSAVCSGQLLAAGFSYSATKSHASVSHPFLKIARTLGARYKEGWSRVINVF